MIYPVVLHKEKNSDYGVTVPDLPGCFSAGQTVDEALDMAREAIELHLEGLIDEALPVPSPQTIEVHQTNPDFKDGTWALVKVDEASLRVKVIRINITLPERVLDAVDQFATQTGETRSGLLAKAAVAFIGREDELPAARRGRPPQKRRAPLIAPAASTPATNKGKAAR